MSSLTWILIAASGFLVAGVLSGSEELLVFVGPPVAPKKPVVDEYHGTKVTDDYRWLENGDDPAVKKWCIDQNRYARQMLDHIPTRKALLPRLTELHSASSPDYYGITFAGNKLFALKSQPPRNQPYLVTLPSADQPDAARVIVDPNQLSAAGTTSMDFYVPSHDGRLVAVCLSEGGSEEGAVHVFDVATGQPLPDQIPRVNYPTAGGSVAWAADNRGFYYTRYPRGEERPPVDRNFYQQIYFHQLGTATADDAYVLGQEFPRIAEIELDSSADGQVVVATVANGDGGDYAHYVRPGTGDWLQITRFTDEVREVKSGPDGYLYLLSRHAAPRGKILRLKLSDPQLSQAEVVVPESEVVIRDFTLAGPRLYVIDLVGGPMQVRVVDLGDRTQRQLPLPPISSVAQVVHLTGDEVLLRTQSYVEPPAWYRSTPALERPVRTALYRTSPADFSDIEVTREFATSKDGTKVPLNILRRKGTPLDGNNPTILYGYGGYSISLSPAFGISRRVWLEQGGVLAIANLRGGGEYGEAWHRAGNLTHKQNVFDDFAACARHLIDAKYTQPKRLAIEGGSNGGLLMGAALTQHPELFGAVIAHVGIFDMLRFEEHPNGAFNVTEFGSVKNLEQFRALAAYSPYQHVHEGTAYPAVLILTGHNDGRVDPHNSRKMTARLQAATSSGKPVLLRYSFDSGHGIGTALQERLAQEADVYAFLTQQLGMIAR